MYLQIIFYPTAETTATCSHKNCSSSPISRRILVKRFATIPFQLAIYADLSYMPQRTSMHISAYICHMFATSSFYFILFYLIFSFFQYLLSPARALVCE